MKDRRNDAIRQAVRTSAYPLALWIAEHWWALTEHVRASAADANALRWTARVRPTWLSRHNLRGAGNGMAWPDILPEGSIARLMWFKGAGLAGQPISFLTSGSAFVPIAEVRAELTEFVESVPSRLDSNGIRGTALLRTSTAWWRQSCSKTSSTARIQRICSWPRTGSRRPATTCMPPSR